MTETSALDLVEARVRELVRESAVDPTCGDRDGLERLIEGALDDHERVASTSVVPRLEDREAARRTLLDRVGGLGPLQPLMDDPGIEEIWVNGPGKVFFARDGQHHLSSVVLDDEEVRLLVERMLLTSGRRVDLSSPFVDAVLSDGSRLHVVIPDVTRRHWAVNIRKFVVRAHRLDELVALGTLNEVAANFLDAAVRAGLNIVVAGGTQTGKTTMLNCLAASIPPRQRVITCEEVFELQVPLPDVVSMQTRQPNLEGGGEITLRRLVVEALRMRPDRLIVGEVRQAEALDLLVALNSGLPGMTSIHANSAREALSKLTTLPLLAGENVSHSFIVPTVARSVDVVVHLSRIGSRRTVTQIIGVTGRAEGGQIETVTLFASANGSLSWTGQHPPRPEAFETAGIRVAEVLR